MRVTIPQLNLKALIDRGGAVRQERAIIAILDHVRLTAADGSLAIASCDQDRFAEATGQATVEATGSICVNGKAFATLIGKHPKTAEVILEVVDDRLVVKCGRSCVRLPILPAKDFPTWADEAPLASFNLLGEDFERAVGRVRYAASTEAARWNLQGVLIDATQGDSLRFVATDTHRLAVSGIAMPDGAADCPRAIVPSEAIDAVTQVMKGISEIAVAVSKGAISFSANNLRLCCRLIDGTYPEYTRIIPERGNLAMTVKRVDFVDCLDRANILTGEGVFSAIRAVPDGENLRLEAANQSGGDAVEELSAVISDGFRPFGFNPRYAAQFLTTLNVGELTIEQSEPDVAHLIYSADAPDFVGMLSPMRI